MAAPLAGVTSASQIAQQKTQDQATQGPKQGASKFDGVMQNKQAGAVQNASQVNATQQTQATKFAQQVKMVDQTAKADKAQIQKNAPKAPVNKKDESSKVMDGLSKMIGDMEKGQAGLEKLIKAGTSGKEFSNGELLSLQAGMYKYTQELELTGKVVEKATTGLKDTLKTQV
jgi:hypothetical protein